MDRRAWLKMTAAASLGGLAPGLRHPARAQAQVSWRGYTYNTVLGATATRGLVRLIDAVQAGSGGRLAIDLHLGGSLPINPTTITPAVADNVITLADDGFFTGNVPIGSLLRMPFLIDTAEEFDRAERISFPYFEKAFAERGVKLLGQYTYAPPTIFSRKPLASLSDLKSQRIRTTSTVQATLLKQLGAVPITMGTPSVAAAVDRGVIDGVMAAGSSVASIWRGLFRYQIDFGPAFVNSAIIVNKAAFEALAPDLQGTVQAAATEACAWATAALMAEEQEAMAKMVSEDHLVATPSPGQEIDRMKVDMPATWQQWAKDTGPDAAEALGKVRAAMGR